MVKIKYDDKVVMRVEQGKRRNNLKGLFDSQIKILEDRNVPELIIAEFQDKKSFVLDKASRMTIMVWKNWTGILDGISVVK